MFQPKGKAIKVPKNFFALLYTYMGHQAKPVVGRKLLIWFLISFFFSFLFSKTFFFPQNLKK